MNRPPTDHAGSDSLPVLYDTRMVPLLFEPYAADLAARLSARGRSPTCSKVAGGRLRRRDPRPGRHPAGERKDRRDPDLNPPSARARGRGRNGRPVEWRQADAMALPFADGSFDAVVSSSEPCSFPTDPHAFAEARRVLRPGGVFLFSVWDRIEENEFADSGDRKRSPPCFRTTRHSFSPGHRTGITIERSSRPISPQVDSAHPLISTIAARSVAGLPPRIPAIAPATARRCATRSRRGTPAASRRPPIVRHRPSPGASAMGRWTGRSGACRRGFSRVERPPSTRARQDQRAMDR